MLCNFIEREMHFAIQILKSNFKVFLIAAHTAIFITKIDENNKNKDFFIRHQVICKI
jgi:hypothetical protein